MKKRYRIVNKKRFYSFILITATILTMLISLIIGKGEVHSSNYYIDYMDFQVMEGDTLWAIANEFAQPDQDIRKIIFDIKALNQMDSGYIYPGDILKIPKNSY